jgi:hypothetical protein
MKTPKLPRTVLSNKILNGILTSGMFMLKLGAVENYIINHDPSP